MFRWFIACCVTVKSIHVFMCLFLVRQIYMYDEENIVLISTLGVTDCSDML